MYVSKSMTFPTLHIIHSRHGLFFTRLDRQANTKPSEKDHDLPGIRTLDLWSSSQHTQPLVKSQCEKGLTRIYFFDSFKCKNPEEPYASPPVNLANTYFRGFRGKAKTSYGIDFFMCFFVSASIQKAPKNRSTRCACVSF
jgi:hypothetical protein